MYLNVLTHSFPTRRSSALERSHKRFRLKQAGTAKASTTVLISGLFAGLALLLGGLFCFLALTRFLFAHLAAIVAISLFLARRRPVGRSEEHTSELQSLMTISYDFFCVQKKTNIRTK